MRVIGSVRARNNNNMRNPSLHPLISGYACYYCYMPSSPVLLHIYTAKKVVVLTIRYAQLPQLQHSYFCNTISQNASFDK